MKTEQHHPVQKQVDTDGNSQASPDQIPPDHDAKPAGYPRDGEGVEQPKADSVNDQ